MKGDGVDELVAFLRDLPEKLRKKHIRQSLKKAARPILKEDRRLFKAELKTFNPRAIDAKGFTSEGKFVVVVGPMRKKVGRKKVNGKMVGGSFIKDAALVHLFERGTKERTTVDGVSRGKITAHHFLARGFAAKVGEAERILKRELTDRIAQEEKAAFG